MKQKRLGKQPPRYRFFLNPYSDVRFTSCPQCGQGTKQRKLPLVIHVDPINLLSINKTCRYCPACDLLIAHKDEIEQQLSQHRPGNIGRLPCLNQEGGGTPDDMPAVVVRDAVRLADHQTVDGCPGA